MKGLIVLLSFAVLQSVSAQPNPALSDRVEGLIIGSLIGDAAGGPHEFQVPPRSRWTTQASLLTKEGREELARSFRLEAYPIKASPYGPWVDSAPAGTITDDSRWKIIFFESLEQAEKLDRQAFARRILHWHADTSSQYGARPEEWLDEYSKSAKWILGQEEADGALPPERVWGGIPTMAGQMPFLPIAAFHPGNPEGAYRDVWKINFMDNGFALDMNAALVAGLAAALVPDASWQSVETAMRRTDPFRYAEVPWVPRKLDVWLDFAHEAVRSSEGVPARLFDILEKDMGAVTWWEAWVPMTVVFACAELTEYHPLATMRLILEFGHDTDSYMQVAGAFFGALHGADVFPAEMREVVETRMEADYGARVGDWMRALGFAVRRESR